MNLLSSQDVCDPAATIQKYLNDADSSASGTEQRSRLAQLSSECIALFQAILRAFSTNKEKESNTQKTVEISIHRSYGRMKTWSDENGVSHGKLDEILGASRALQRETLKHVVSISQTLTDSKIFLKFTTISCC